jgi:hypothetical protein
VEVVDSVGGQITIGEEVKGKNGPFKHTTFLEVDTGGSELINPLVYYKHLT